jgi:ribonuclease D
VTDVATADTQRDDDLRPVVDDAGLQAVVSRLRSVDRYALDTEFHREKTYWPRVALVQIAWPEGPAGPAGLALIDPQAVDLAPLAEILAGQATMVAHAAEQDLEVLQLACGCGPGRLWDTQVAAGFAGHGSASLASLSSAYLGLDVAKGDRLTDWSVRPLSASQLRYAAADVDHLIELADLVTADLDARNRRAWAEEECELLRTRRLGGNDPARAWWRLRDARQLRGAARGVAQEVTAWREERARRLDIPVRHVLPDLALQSIAHRPPATAAALAAVRGLDSRFLRGDAGAGILAAAERGRHLAPGDLQLPPADEVPKEMRPAVALAMAWMAQLARDEAVDPTLLATRSDVVALLRGDPAARLASGWRAGLAGTALQRLVAGEAALAFDGAGGLVLEARSRRPLDGPG